MIAPRVIVIGNAATLQGSNLGSVIDTFDVVVRCNCFRIDGHESDVGTRITHWGFADHREASQHLLRQNNTVASVGAIERLWYWRGPSIAPEAFEEFRAMVPALGDDRIECCDLDLPTWMVTALNPPRASAASTRLVRRLMAIAGAEPPTWLIHQLDQRRVTTPAMRCLRNVLRRLGRRVPNWMSRAFDPPFRVNTGLRVLGKAIATWPKSHIAIAGFGTDDRPAGYYFSAEPFERRPSRANEIQFLSDLVRAGRIVRLDG